MRFDRAVGFALARHARSRGGAGCFECEPCFVHVTRAHDVLRPLLFASFLAPRAAGGALFVAERPGYRCGASGTTASAVSPRAATLPLSEWRSAPYSP